MSLKVIESLMNKVFEQMRLVDLQGHKNEGYTSIRKKYILTL